jgi:hypothetical protein
MAAHRRMQQNGVNNRLRIWASGSSNLFGRANFSPLQNKDGHRSLLHLKPAFGVLPATGGGGSKRRLGFYT